MGYIFGYILTLGELIGATARLYHKGCGVGKPIDLDLPISGLWIELWIKEGNLNTDMGV